MCRSLILCGYLLLRWSLVLNYCLSVGILLCGSILVKSVVLLNCIYLLNFRTVRSSNLNDLGGIITMNFVIWIYIKSLFIINNFNSNVFSSSPQFVGLCRRGLIYWIKFIGFSNDDFIVSKFSVIHLISNIHHLLRES